jgi:hypothetical protein
METILWHVDWWIQGMFYLYGYLLLFAVQVTLSKDAYLKAFFLERLKYLSTRTRNIWARKSKYSPTNNIKVFIAVHPLAESCLEGMYRRKLHITTRGHLQCPYTFSGYNKTYLRFLASTKKFSLCRHIVFVQ